MTNLGNSKGSGSVWSDPSFVPMYPYCEDDDEDFDEDERHPVPEKSKDFLCSEEHGVIRDDDLHFRFDVTCLYDAVKMIERIVENPDNESPTTLVNEIVGKMNPAQLHMKLDLLVHMASIEANNLLPE